VHENKDLTQLPFSKRREILSSVVRQSDHIELSAVSNKSAKGMLAFVKKMGLEGGLSRSGRTVF
jgi:ATP-dependent DNA ligase